jgi:porin
LVQEIWGTQDVHLAIFTIEQKLFDGKLDVQLGRTTANVNFLDSPIYCNFQTNSACGDPTFIFKVSNFTFFPASTWGGDAKLWLSDKVYFHAGAYEVNPNNYRLSNSGFDWSTTNATGAIIPFELGYATTFANDELPRHYQIGGLYDGSKYSNPLYHVNGGYASISGLPYATDFGRSGMFARFDQMVWRPDPDSKRGLTTFGVFMTGLSGNLTQNQFYELGLVQQGIFPGRDDDTLGFVINAQVWSNAALKNVAVARIAAGVNGYIPRSGIYDGARLWRAADPGDPHIAQPAIYHQSGSTALPVADQQHSQRLRRWLQTQHRSFESGRISTTANLDGNARNGVPCSQSWGWRFLMEQLLSLIAWPSLDPHGL